MESREVPSADAASTSASSSPEDSTDVELLQRLEKFFLPLSPEEAADRLRANTGSGVLTRNMIIRALGGEPTEGS